MYVYMACEREGYPRRRWRSRGTCRRPAASAVAPGANMSLYLLTCGAQIHAHIQTRVTARRADAVAATPGAPSSQPPVLLYKYIGI